jgi:hypothetical protein
VAIVSEEFADRYFGGDPLLNRGGQRQHYNVISIDAPLRRCTDNDWFALDAAKTDVEEVNFWRPSPEATFKVLQPGELLLFKLKAPNDSIAGGGFFTRFLQMSINTAWETFGVANRVTSLPEFRARIARIRNITMAPADNPTVGCIMLAEPFFWPKSGWIPRAPEFAVSSQVGKTFDSEESAGRRLWDAVCERLKRSPEESPPEDCCAPRHASSRPVRAVPGALFPYGRLSWAPCSWDRRRPKTRQRAPYAWSAQARVTGPIGASPRRIVMGSTRVAALAGR